MPLAHNTLISAAFTVTPRPRSTAVIMIAAAADLRIIGPPQFLHGGLTLRIRRGGRSPTNDNDARKDANLAVSRNPLRPSTSRRHQLDHSHDRRLCPLVFNRLHHSLVARPHVARMHRLGHAVL